MRSGAARVSTSSRYQTQIPCLPGGFDDHLAKKKSQHWANGLDRLQANGDVTVKGSRLIFFNYKWIDRKIRGFAHDSF